MSTDSEVCVNRANFARHWAPCVAVVALFLPAVVLLDRSGRGALARDAAAAAGGGGDDAILLISLAAGLGGNRSGTSTSSSSAGDVLTSSSASAAGVSPRRPHILFIMADQHRHDAISGGIAPLGATPALDRLRREVSGAV